MGGAPGAAQLLGDFLPASAGGQDEPDHPEGGAVVDPRPAALGPDGLLRWQVMRDGVEELVRHMGCGHDNRPQGEGLSIYGANPMPRRFCQSFKRWTGQSLIQRRRGNYCVHRESVVTLGIDR